MTDEKIDRDEIFTMSKDEEFTKNELIEFINKHKNLVNRRYKVLYNQYLGDCPILHQPNKEEWKPDNRVVVNFAKYIVDTMNGFFIGVPVKMYSDDEAVNDYINLLDKYNDQEDNNAELSKIMSIFGKGFELYFNDENSNVGITYLNPMDGFMIYDDTVLQKPLRFVYYYYDDDEVMHGSVYDEFKEKQFTDKGGIHFIDEILHSFSDVPATEFIENEERQSIFEPVLNNINKYNKALSEKANDVDYFADAYLKILGAKLEKEDLDTIRDKRILNFEGNGASDILVEFMNKPDGDTTQENYINRLERLIFQNSMIANINDENFGTASGIAIKYRLLSMSNLAEAKKRKFESGLNRRYKVIFSNPINKMSSDDWMSIKYKFTKNFPANLLEEVQTAAQMAGVTSKETQLSVISAVSDVKAEMDRIKENNDTSGYSTDYPTNRIIEETQDDLLGGITEVQGKQLNGAQTQSLIAIMAQFSGGILTEGQAINLISTAIGITKEEARSILNGDM